MSLYLKSNVRQEVSMSLWNYDASTFSYEWIVTLVMVTPHINELSAILAPAYSR